MQDYISLAKKNGVTLAETGSCQFCGANTKRGVHECLEIFNLGFETIDFSDPQNHKYRFFIVDAHTLQHPELHGRWNNHFHLLRLHLIFTYKIAWNYSLSPKLSDYLNAYKKNRKDEYLRPPERLNRGKLTSTDILAVSEDPEKCKIYIEHWAKDVYESWSSHHALIDTIAKGFLNRKSHNQRSQNKTVR